MISVNETRHFKKCKHCRGKDGKQKDIYVTFQSAFDTAEFIEKDRGIYLNVYKCPHGNGWHLTSNDASSEILDRKEMLFQKNEIPTISPDGSWEYINDEFDGSNELIENKINNIKIDKRNRRAKKNPIVKIEYKPDIKNMILTGKVMEVVKDIDIEKIFNINFQNIIFAKQIKNILDGAVDQITVYKENGKKGQIESYTVLLKRELIKKHGIKKGNDINLNISGITINKINRWCCG